MCYKIPHTWTCGHTYAWSPVHCPIATASHLQPTEHCGQPMAPGDPNWTIKEAMPCPECQHKDDSSSNSDKAEKTEDVPMPSSVAHELAALERELEDLEAGDLDHALRESAHHHSLLHESHLEEAKKKSLAEAPEQQSLEAYAEAMQQAREASQRHWEEELGMGVYVDHEEAVKRARLESYRELLEGYKALRGRVGEGEGDGEGVAEGSKPVDTAATTTATSTTAAGKKSRTWRWPFQDDEHRQLYEDDNQPASAAASSSRLREGAAADPAESFARRSTSHASGASQPAGDETDVERPEKSAREVHFARQRSRHRGLFKRIRSKSSGGGDK